MADDFIVRIAVDGAVLEGTLTVPRNATGIIVFAHGNGIGRRAVRNLHLAEVLNKVGFATLVIDLLLEVEARACDIRFNAHLLTERLIKVIEWIWSNTETECLPIALLGTGAGAAAALRTAAVLPEEIKVVISRSGRTDLAEGTLWRVACPTLLIVGDKDAHLIELNKKALSELHCKKSMEIVPGATHLFEEGDTLEMVAELVTSWCYNHCCAAPPKPQSMPSESNMLKSTVYFSFATAVELLQIAL